MDSEDEGFMREAIKVARRGIERGNSPFGCVIVKSGRIIARAHNTVSTKRDSTNHAEINAIKFAEKRMDKMFLEGCDLYTTAEPCPMCFSAIHWARIKTVFFGAKIEDAKKAGFNELTISAKEMKESGGSKVKLKEGVLKKECVKLFEEWKKKGKSKAY